jgi:hypothetical protein
VLLLIDLGLRWQTRDAFFSEWGVLPLELQRELISGTAGKTGPLSWSLHTLSDSPTWLLAMFALSALSYTMLIAGFQTRLASIASFVLLASWHVRNPLLMHSGDTLLRISLFWSMFLPLGAVWSVESWRRRRRGEPVCAGEVISPATAGLVMLLFSLYFFAGVAKLTPRWLDGTAMEYVLRLDIYATRAGQALLQFPALLQFITWATLVIELVFPFLLLSPWRNRMLRMIAMIVFVAFHAGIAVSMSLGTFQYAAMMIWLALIPGSLWSRAGRGVRQSGLFYATPRASLPRSPARPVVFAASLFFVVYFLFWNTANVVHFDWCRECMPQPARVVGRWLNTRQEFQMFDYPPKHNRWFVYDARLANGEQMDVFRHSPVTHEKPDSVLATMPPMFWRQFHINIRTDSTVYERIRQQAARHVAEAWNRTHAADEHVVSLRVTAYFDEIAPDPDKPGGQIRQVWAQFGESEPADDLFRDLYEQMRDRGEILP